MNTITIEADHQEMSYGMDRWFIPVNERTILEWPSGHTFTWHGPSHLAVLALFNATTPGAHL